MARLPATRTLRRAARWLWYQVEPAALILMYHRVAALSTDPWLLAVRPGHFAEQLEVLRQQARPTTLQALHRAVAQGRVPRRAVVVTFDDGYADNLANALPLLERFDVPATFFVTSGFIGSKHDVWSDEVDGLFLQPGTLPQRLRLSVNGRWHEWSLGETVVYDEATFRRQRGWTVRRDDDPTPRQRIYRDVHALLKPLAESARQPIMDQLRAWAGRPSLRRPSHRTMTPDELVALAASRLVEVGAHSVTHPLLPSLPRDAQRHEIAGSKADLEAILGRPVVSFSYPYGPHTPETVALVREAGFTSACSTAQHSVRRSPSPFQLPRLKVDDWDGAQLAQRLRRWFLS